MNPNNSEVSDEFSALAPRGGYINIIVFDKQNTLKHLFVVFDMRIFKARILD